MSDGTNELPHDPIDEAERPTERVAPSAGQAAVISGGADASAGAAIEEDLADQRDDVTEDDANPI